MEKYNVEISKIDRIGCVAKQWKGIISGSDKKECLERILRSISMDEYFVLDNIGACVMSDDGIIDVKIEEVD